MPAPVVVQGSAVSSPYGGQNNGVQSGTANQGNNSNSNNANASQDEPASTGCKDPLFAILFYVNVAAMVVVAGTMGSSVFGQDSGGFDYSGYLYAVVISCLFSLILSGMGLLVLMKFPETIIKVALIFVIIITLLWVVLSILSGSFIVAVIAFVIFAITVCYARAAWPRIPFATVNLVTAITAIKANFGVTLFAYGFALLAAAWSIIWMIAFAGLYDTTYSCSDSSGSCSPSYGLIFIIFLSFFFTHQVLQNSIHVTVAGVVGSWWVAPAENGFCSTSVINSFIRTMTTSFGSVCFGSLLVAILQALRVVAETAQAEDGGIGACIAVCILRCLESLLEYFNKWAFVYVGVYGFPYLEAGKNVFALFRNRGWEAIIADDLIANALLLVSFGVGVIMGAIALIFTVITDWFDEAAGNPRGIAFLLGFIVGIAICSILLSTIGSAVNAIIVLFADAPNDFQRNYPDLSRRMRQTWSEIYPGSI